MKRIDIQGKRFGRLLVIQYAGDSKWVCRCDCGNELTVSSSNLRSGGTSSCGCYRRETARAAHYKHGGKGTRLYGIWKAMRKRCANRNSPDFPNYGGRGIKVCSEWQQYEVFKAWAISNGYSDSLSIDRIDPDGDYCPKNCRWATLHEQATNKRKTIEYTLNGVTKPLAEWCSELGVNYSTARHRIFKQHLTGEAVFRT